MWKSFCLWRSVKWGGRGIKWMAANNETMARYCFDRAHTWNMRANYNNE